MPAATASPRRTLSFGLKLTLAMVLMMTGVSVAAVLVVRLQVDRAYRQFLGERFEEQAKLFFQQRDARLAATREALQASKVRLFAALEEDPIKIARLYDDAKYELRGILPAAENSPAGEILRPAVFYRLFDADGHDLPPPSADPQRGGFVSESELADSLGPFTKVADGNALAEAGQAAVGYAVFGQSAVYEIMALPIVDTVEGKVVGFLVFGQLLNLPRDFGRGTESLHNGLLLNGHLISISNTLPAGLAVRLNALLRPGGGADEGAGFTDADGVEHLIFFRQLQKNEGLPPAWQISLYSLGQLQALTRQIAVVVVGVTFLALLFGVLFATFISRRLTLPILNLVGATEAVARGDYTATVAVSSRDEIGRLSGAFNEMTAGLALKEKYRNVLDRVSDHEVAERLLHGQLTLGGELRDVSVLFCDIRGFTPLTESMDPAHVVEFLNEHMTALTAVVHRHRGVVDKFVGDSLMALFGAPKSYGHDAQDAAACALALVAERERLSAATGRALRVGVGVATGKVLAGCMGSMDRLNYTVLGDRVNLAARLCARAQAGEALIDDATRAALGDTPAVEALEPVSIKGFSQPIPVFRLHHARVAALT